MTAALADTLARRTGLHVYPASALEAGPACFFLARVQGRKQLGILGEAAGFPGTSAGEVRLFPTTIENAARLREHLPWLKPQPLGLKRAAGSGDRLGLATPGHARAFRRARGIAPVFAQQSIRENARTGRSPAEVINDATWGVFQEGWREPWGADADHLKTPEDLDSCIAAGYTFYTLDPGDHVDAGAVAASGTELKVRWEALPWAELDTEPSAQLARYTGRAFALDGGGALSFTEEDLRRAAVKYGRALAHVTRMYRHLASRVSSFDLEVSVDETEAPTLPLEHFYIASELKRLGVRWVSLAPRYPGRFEKGVDYLGDIREFETDLAMQAAVARTLGPYKLGIHSGSDKFTLYPVFARLAGDLVHLKTAGTSYLEGLRAIAAAEPELYRTIYRLAFDRYAEDRKSYHVSADPARAPRPKELADGDLPGVLDQFDAREMLHVTFGSALAAHGPQIKASLERHEEAYYEALVRHFDRHLQPFSAADR